MFPENSQACVKNISVHVNKFGSARRMIDIFIREASARNEWN